MHLMYTNLKATNKLQKTVLILLSAIINMENYIQTDWPNTGASFQKFSQLCRVADFTEAKFLSDVKMPPLFPEFLLSSHHSLWSYWKATVTKHYFSHAPLNIAPYSKIKVMDQL